MPKYVLLTADGQEHDLDRFIDPSQDRAFADLYRAVTYWGGSVVDDDYVLTELQIQARAEAMFAALIYPRETVAPLPNDAGYHHADQIIFDEVASCTPDEFEAIHQRLHNTLMVRTWQKCDELLRKPRPLDN